MLYPQEMVELASWGSPTVTACSHAVYVPVFIALFLLLTVIWK